MIDKAGNDLATDAVFLAKQSIVGFGWVCAPKHLTLEQVQAATEEQIGEYCPGTPWTVVSRKHDDPELVSPGVCGQCPDTRQHWFALGGRTAVVLLAASADSSGFPEDLQLKGL